MQKILQGESFSAPQRLKIISYILSPALILMGIALLMMKDAVGEVTLLVPLIFLIAVSMFFYARLKLIISDKGICFTGGLKRHTISWNDITKVDMVRLGKYKTPKAVIHYSGRKLELHKGFYLKIKFNRILLLLEIKIPPELFTERYQEIRHTIN
jgi:hypothetical protein